MKLEIAIHKAVNLAVSICFFCLFLGILINKEVCFYENDFKVLFLELMLLFLLVITNTTDFIHYFKKRRFPHLPRKKGVFWKHKINSRVM